MTEKRIWLDLNPTLLRDAQTCADNLEMEVERFLEEIIESQVATWRLNKEIPMRVKTKNRTSGVRNEANEKHRQIRRVD